MASHFNILTLRTAGTVLKSKKRRHQKMNPPRLIDVNMLLEKNREIAPEGMKRLSQSGNKAQVWMYLVVKVKSDAVMNSIA